MTWELSVTGLLIGLLVGMTGMGGGALLTPLLILLFGRSPAASPFRPHTIDTPVGVL
jgi:uncharacterized protein